MAEKKITVKDLKNTIVNDLYYDSGEHWVAIEYCCGIIEIGEFEMLKVGIVDDLNTEQRRKFSSLSRNTRIRLLAQGFKVALMDIIKADNGAFFIASTAAPKHGGYKQATDQAAAELALRALKFKSQGTRRSPSTGNNITLWIRKG